MKKQINGPLYPIHVKYVSAKQLLKLANAKGEEEILGYFNSGTNTIYVDRGLEPIQRRHTFFHELNHAVEYQLQSLNEEGRCDVMGTWLSELIDIKNL